MDKDDSERPIRNGIIKRRIGEEMTPEVAEAFAEDPMANLQRTAVRPGPAAVPSIAPEVPTPVPPAIADPATVAQPVGSEQREDVITRLIAKGLNRQQAEEKITAYLERQPLRMDPVTKADASSLSQATCGRTPPALSAGANAVPPSVCIPDADATSDADEAGDMPEVDADEDDYGLTMLPGMLREGRRHLLSVADVATELGVVKITIVRWVESGLMPSPDFVVGTGPAAAWAWDTTSLEDWLVGAKKERTRS
jgi:hypothetical protein